MKALRITRYLALSMIAFAALSACKKRGDYEVPCKIKKITEKYRFYDDQPFEITTLTFNYTSWGDPESLIFSQTSTGKPNYYFKYDSQRRLIQRKDQYGPGNIEYLVKYKYDSNNFIVSDSSWYGGVDENNTAGFWSSMAHQYFYDAKGRVSKVVTTQGNFTYTDTYAYDAKGNLIKDGAVYDNKVNFLRTNLVLAFINRDYSMNNAGPALTYNSKNLPNTFSTSWKTDYVPRFMNMMANEIEYTCDSYNHD